MYGSFLLPVVLFTLWDTTTGPATPDAELAAQKNAIALMNLLLWPAVVLPFALLFTWLISLTCWGALIVKLQSGHLPVHAAV